jgi:hypothetical protein
MAPAGLSLRCANFCLSPLHCVPMPRLWRGPVRPVCRALKVPRKEGPVLWADLNCSESRREGRYVAARGREERGRTLARVIGRGASLEGDHVCAAMERAVTQQPPDRGGINVVGPRYIRLRLASDLVIVARAYSPWPPPFAPPTPLRVCHASLALGPVRVVTRGGRAVCGKAARTVLVQRG